MILKYTLYYKSSTLQQLASHCDLACVVVAMNDVVSRAITTDVVV